MYKKGIKKSIKEIKNNILNRNPNLNVSQEDIKKAVDKIETHKILSNSHKILSNNHKILSETTKMILNS